MAALYQVSFNTRREGREFNTDGTPDDSLTVAANGVDEAMRKAEAHYRRTDEEWRATEEAQEGDEPSPPLAADGFRVHEVKFIKEIDVA